MRSIQGQSESEHPLGRDVQDSPTTRVLSVAFACADTPMAKCNDRNVLTVACTFRSTPRVVAYLYGGQGTLNVPSWSPDSKQVAFVSNTVPYAGPARWYPRGAIPETAVLR